jgi:2-oxoglutarate dehydrogenase E2 component (dihydrolipoamide succinyltransferase)
LVKRTIFAKNLFPGTLLMNNMTLIEMVMPKMGESIMEGTILRWLKKPGDKIEPDESVLEVATDKVDTEVPALQGGYLHSLLAKEGEVVPIGKTIALISPVPLSENTQPPAPQLIKESELPPVQAPLSSSSNGKTPNPFRLEKAATGRFYSPLVLTIAREEGISMQELEFIAGTGGDDRVTKKDILNYLSAQSGVPVEVETPVLKQEAETPVIPLGTSPASFINLEKAYAPKYVPPAEREPQPVEEESTPVEVPFAPVAETPEEKPAEEHQPVAETPELPTEEPEKTPEPVEAPEPEPEKAETVYFAKEPQEAVESPAVSVNGNMEIIEMDRMRKMIAQRMVDSVRISPHVTSFVEADVTNIVFWRNRVKHEFKEKEGDAITFTPLFIEAIAKALKDYPMMNISVDGDKIIVKKDIHVGMAVALPNGNLIVPVIHNADRLNLIGLTKKVNDLAKRARENKLKMEDLEGGTYTASNIGSFGNVMGTPIIMQPQVGIMSFGAVQKKPAVIETPYGDTLGIRHMMYLSHSYDHRVVDGSLGGMFVRRVADYLESFDVNRKIF